MIAGDKEAAGASSGEGAACVDGADTRTPGCGRARNESGALDGGLVTAVISPLPWETRP